MALPGEYRTIKNDYTECEEEGCIYPAKYKLCTESDSFGDEWTCFCEAHMPDPNADHISDCDQCHVEDVAVVPTRDPEEVHGPVSFLCKTCLSEHRNYVNSLMEDLYEYND